MRAWKWYPTPGIYLSFQCGGGCYLISFQGVVEKYNEVRISPDNTSNVLIKQELLPVTNYSPDIETIKKNGVKVIMANGKISVEKKRFYAETVPILAEKLGCEMITFPGHHISFFDMPDEWASTLRKVLQN